jgi:aromatic ring hydroxylase
MACATTVRSGTTDSSTPSSIRDVLTVEAPELGGRMARAFGMPRTPVQRRLKRQAYIVWAEASCGMLGRSPDFMNVMLTALAASGASCPR